MNIKFESESIKSNKYFKKLFFCIHGELPVEGSIGTIIKGTSLSKKKKEKEMGQKITLKKLINYLATIQKIIF